MTVLSTHFIIGQSLSKSVYDQLTQDAKYTIDLVSKLNDNLPCKHVDPNLTCSTDDTTIFVHEGVEQKKRSLVNAHALKNRSMHSLHKIDEENENLNGMRIKMTTFHSASGL